jgi:hypothetical protein
MTEREPDAATRRIIDEARAFVTSRPAPDLTGDVMRRISEIRVAPARLSVWQQLSTILWAPREISLRPAYVVGAAALLLLVTVAFPLRSAASRTNPQLFVQFRLDAPDATDVRLAGSFTNWEPRYELHEVAPGNWTITLPLSAGVHDYVFVVNGQRWIPDPYASRIDDGFGGVNSRISLVIPDAPRL